MNGAPEGNPSRDLAIPRLAAALIVLAIPTLLLSRAILPALPGSRSGIEQLIDRLGWISQVSSQVLALGLVLLVIRLVSASLGEFALGVVGRLLALPVGSGVALLLLIATLGPLDPEMHLVLAGLGTLAIVAALRPTLRYPSMRAAGLLLLLSLLSSLTNSSGRWLALRASLEALPDTYAWARILSTASLVFDVAALLWILTWLVLSAPRQSKYERYRTLAYVVIALTTAVSFALLGRLGHSLRSSFLEIILGRAMAALSREPAPLGGALVGPSLDILSVLLAGLLLTLPRHIPGPNRWGMALVLLGRNSPDIPLHAALLTTGALLLSWHLPICLGHATTPNAAPADAPSTS